MRLILATVLTVVPALALAQDRPARPMLSEACRTEMEKLCPVSADGDRRARMQCMMAANAKLTAPCAKEVAERRAAMQKWRAENGGMGRGIGGDGSAPTPPPAD